METTQTTFVTFSTSALLESFFCNLQNNLVIGGNHKIFVSVENTEKHVRRQQKTKKTIMEEINMDYKRQIQKFREKFLPSRKLVIMQLTNRKDCHKSGRLRRASEPRKTRAFLVVRVPPFQSRDSQTQSLLKGHV